MAFVACPDVHEIGFRVLVGNTVRVEDTVSLVAGHQTCGAGSALGGIAWSAIPAGTTDMRIQANAIHLTQFGGIVVATDEVIVFIEEPPPPPRRRPVGFAMPRYR